MSVSLDTCIDIAIAAGERILSIYQTDFDVQTKADESPLTQADLADMSGATAVHANRALRELRERGLAEFRRGRLFSTDRAGLEEYADFSADYLYGEGQLSPLPGPVAVRPRLST